MKTTNGQAARIVAQALTGHDTATVIIGAKAYIIAPPTIRTIALAAEQLSEFADAQTMLDIVKTDIRKAAAALSCFINGDEAMTEELSNASLKEITEALEAAYALCSPQGFIKLSALAKNVTGMIAQAK